MPPSHAAVDPGHAVADQEEVFAFLADPATHGGAEVVRIDTHGAAVFLAGERALKAKRAVLFPFMDFSTPEKRRAACRAEVEVNAEAAPGIYRGVLPVTRRRDGGLALGGDGPAVEWVVDMRRFDETSTLDLVAERGGLAPDLVDAVTDAVLASHARAPLRPGDPAVDALARYLDQNREAFAEQPDVFPPRRAEALDARARAAFAAAEPVMRARGRAGLVRRCHGDLHLRNVALVDGRPLLFDAVEFDEGIATCDVLYDLAFLLMDLVERGHRPEAARVLNRYLAGCDADMAAGLAALPLFLSIRATIRAKVVAAALSRLAPAARAAALDHVHRYFALAEAALEPAPLVLVAVGGLSGAGKSTVADALSPAIGRLPGAVRLSSDLVRKALAGVGPTVRLPASAYGAERSAAVYEALRARAAAVLAVGHSVVVDAVHARPEEREAVAGVARSAGAAFVGLWLEAPPAVLEDRVARRRGDPSDATVDVVRAQLARGAGPVDWIRVDASGPADAVAGRAAASLRAAAAAARRA